MCVFVTHFPLCARIRRSVCSSVCCSTKPFKWILWPQLLIKQKKLFSLLPSSLFSHCFLCALSGCVLGHRDGRERLGLPVAWQFIAGLWATATDHYNAFFCHSVCVCVCFFFLSCWQGFYIMAELSSSDCIREEKQVGRMVFNQCNVLFRLSYRLETYEQKQGPWLWLEVQPWPKRAYVASVDSCSSQVLLNTTSGLIQNWLHCSCVSTNVAIGS